jgi:hypothetical protein
MLGETPRPVDYSRERVPAVRASGGPKLKFTFYCYLPAALILALCYVNYNYGAAVPNVGLVWLFGLFLLMAGTFVAGIYWLVRLVRHAWGNGSAAHQAPPSIEYSEPDSGRIFGRLN